MSNNQQYNISNEQLLLINILNGMYNDNLRQINNIYDSIYSLNESNRQIRNILIQILNNHTNIHNNNSNSNNKSNNRRNNSRYNQRSNLRETANLSSGGLGRVYLNNRPYIIDNIQHYNIPLNREVDNNISELIQNFFQPIEVFPTQTQIESATRIVRYCDIISPRNRSCPISLENFNDADMVSVIRFCGHIFNTEQLNTWFRSNCRCPVCRYDIRRYNSTTSTEFLNSNESSSQPLNSIPSTSSTSFASSIPVNVTESNSSNSTEERRSQTNSGRNSNALLFLNTILDTITNTNDNNLSDIETIGGSLFTDISGNNTSDVIYNLLNEFNNRANR
jgi:hypothetical protein